jgi:hypothetical protein
MTQVCVLIGTVYSMRFKAIIFLSWYHGMGKIPDLRKRMIMRNLCKCAFWKIRVLKSISRSLRVLRVFYPVACKGGTGLAKARFDPFLWVRGTEKGPLRGRPRRKNIIFPFFLRLLTPRNLSLSHLKARAIPKWGCRGNKFIENHSQLMGVASL